MLMNVTTECYRLCPDRDLLCFADLKTMAIVATVLAILGLVVLGLTIANLNRFLAKHEPIAADVLVVEGWLPDYAIAAAMAEFNIGTYDTLITIGAPLPRGSYLAEYKTFAELAGATLIALGFDPARLQVVSTPYAPECRTQNAAVALKQHFASTDDLKIRSIDVFTLGTHARRTQLIFRKVFPQPMQVGIISTKVLAYDERSWWRSSEGVRTVLGETIAYIYQRVWG